MNAVTRERPTISMPAGAVKDPLSMAVPLYQSIPHRAFLLCFGGELAEALNAARIEVVHVFKRVGQGDPEATYERHAPDRDFWQRTK
jgi:hypothetical protein